MIREDEGKRIGLKGGGESGNVGQGEEQGRAWERGGKEIR